MSRIGDICKVINGRAYLMPELQDSGKYRILRVGNFFNSDKWYYSDLELPPEKYCEEGDLLFAWSCSFGPKIWHGEKTIYHYHIWKLVEDKDIVDRKWLYYWLMNSVAHMTASNHGSVMMHMTKAEMESLEITLPPLATQQRIAAVLGVLDDKIELNRKMNANLEAQAQALFKSWFVDFEPFGGKMPEGWKKRNLSDIASFVSGYSYKSSELKDSSIAMATIKNFERNGGFKLDGFKEIAPSGKLKSEQEVCLFDTLVAHTDLTQNAEVVGNAEMLLSSAGYERIIMSSDLVKVVPKAGVSKFLIGALLKNRSFKAHCLGYVNGTTVLHMSKSALKEYSLYLPEEIAQLDAFVSTIEPIYRLISNKIEESRKLAETRDALLPKLMKGSVSAGEPLRRDKEVEV